MPWGSLYSERFQAIKKVVTYRYNESYRQQQASVVKYVMMLRRFLSLRLMSMQSIDPSLATARREFETLYADRDADDVITL